ncbi:hypothetical protein K2E96_16430 [Pseudomonas sp. ERGC3:05]|nr:hypothetical protein [Pseudomonas sp. ERGC3:01]QZC92707.1 hypothetical protein K2E96_16430 [Pseudomonas sp. ERGC3:05]
MPNKNLSLKRQRAEQVNQVIRIIGTHGRRFFFNQAGDRFASMEVDHRGFSHGGTLRSLVEGFRDYIRTGELMHPGYLGPERFDYSNIWGYDEEGMKAVREQAGALPVFRQPVAEAA